MQPYYDVTKRSPNVTFGGTVTLGMVENIIGLVEDADVIHDGNYCFITTPLDKSKWKVIPAAVNYPEYLWMGSLENETRRVGRGSRVREYVTEY